MFRSRDIFGRLRRLEPVSRVFGFDRGMPIDRYYIEKFLERHSADITGRALEIADNTYTKRFGKNVSVSEVLHFTQGNPEATVIADLRNAPEIPGESFDAIVCTQTLQSIYEAPQAVATLHRILKPGGVLLVTLPGLCQISRFDMDRWGDFWRFTNLSVERLFGEHFAPANLRVETFGNVLAATAFIQGIEREELKAAELDHHDPDYQILIAVRAVKPATVPRE